MAVFWFFLGAYYIWLSAQLKREGSTGLCIAYGILGAIFASQFVLAVQVMLD